jgi:methylated-DNA-[protein]-cysteine S-methyltransferase
MVLKNKKSFNERCYEILVKVPRGKVTTYGEIAKKLKSKAYRAVGNAMNKNPYGYCAISSEAIRNRRSAIRGDSKRNNGFFLVPCHRVVNSNGEIGGYAHGKKKKIEMLKKEGIEIKNNRIDLKKYLYKF